MKNRNPHKAAIFFAGPTVTAIAAVLLVVCLVLFLIVVPAVVRALILKETRLLNGTETWEKWTDIKIPILIKFNIFNVTNIEDAENGGKFKLQEVGPYVWEEKRTKQIIGVDEDEDTVSYREVVHYYFRRDLSVGSQEDTVNIINVPFLSASTLIYKLLYSSLANYLIDFFMSMDEKFVLRDVNIRELVFDGVHLGATYENLADFGIVELPDEFVEGTFAFYNQKNGTPSKEFKVNRGIKNYKDFGKIVEFDHQKKLSYWTNQSLPEDSQHQYCNKINGTDGSVFAPFVSKDQRLRIFNPEICRSIYLRFDKELNFEGIPAYRFSIPEELLQDPYTNGENQCFCTDPGSGLANSCRGHGAIRMFSCKKGIPIGLSLPHFLQGDKRYHEEVEGMKPDPSKHETDIIIEPNSGAILRIVKRIQISTEFQRLPGITAFSKVFEAIVPIFWVEERGDLAETDVAEIRDRLVVPLEILRVWKPIVLAMLVLSFISGVLMSLYEIYFIRPQRIQCISIL